MREILIGILICMFCAVHVFIPSIESALNKYKKIWVSVTSGIAVGYVFLYMLPKLSDYTTSIISSTTGGWEFLHYRVYIFALLGFLAYLAVDIWSASENPRAVHWRQIQSVFFCLYCFLMGYISPKLPRPGILPVLLASLPLCAHFMGIDHLLYTWHAEFYKKVLRWLMSLSVIIGWLLGRTTELHGIFLVPATAFMSGGILINAIQEELPNRGKGDFRAFLVGVIFFVIISALVRSFPRL